MFDPTIFWVYYAVLEFVKHSWMSKVRYCDSDSFFKIEKIVAYLNNCVLNSFLSNFRRERIIKE